MTRIFSFLTIFFIASCSSVGQFGAGVDITFDPRTIGIGDDTIMQKEYPPDFRSNKKYFLNSVRELMVEYSYQKSR